MVLLFGERLVGWGAGLFRNLDRHTYKILYPLVLCFMLAWLADLIGLAPIIGAFAAGLILSERHFEKYHDAKPALGDMFKPLETFFAPVFFVLMGMQVNLVAFLQSGAWSLALVLIAVAVVGKLAAGLAAGRGVRRLAVGFGMVPRGEVGLIFAGVGKATGVVPDFLFSAIVMVVMVTTFVAPVALHWSLSATGR